MNTMENHPRMNTELQAVIFDWAGTTVDHGSFAPTQILVDAFERACNFPLALAEARAPMGLGKWQHIEALGRLPSVAARWQAQFGREMNPADVDRIYSSFLPLQIERVAEHASLIPGTLETVAALRAGGLKIGSTTGYPRAVMQRLLQAAAQRGYQPDCTVCTDDLKAGSRPGPWMALQCVLELKIEAVWRCVKVDDTLPGLLESRNAGMWTVGVLLSGSPAGLTWEECLQSGAAERETIRQRVAAELGAAQPHYLIDSVADLLPVLEHIEQRLRQGERP